MVLAALILGLVLGWGSAVVVFGVLVGWVFRCAERAI